MVNISLPEVIIITLVFKVNVNNVKIVKLFLLFIFLNILTRKRKCESDYMKKYTLSSKRLKYLVSKFAKLNRLHHSLLSIVNRSFD